MLTNGVLTTHADLHESSSIETVTPCLFSGWQQAFVIQNRRTRVDCLPLLSNVKAISNQKHEIPVIFFFLAIGCSLKWTSWNTYPLCFDDNSKAWAFDLGIRTTCTSQSRRFLYFCCDQRRNRSRKCLAFVRDAAHVKSHCFRIVSVQLFDHGEQDVDLLLLYE